MERWSMAYLRKTQVFLHAHHLLTLPLDDISTFTQRTLEKIRKISKQIYKVKCTLLVNQSTCIRSRQAGKTCKIQIETRGHYPQQIVTIMLLSRLQHSLV